jgi:hypothetical protein
MNKNILTHGAKISAVTQGYYSSVATIPNSEIPVTNYYCFLSKVDVWPNDQFPPAPSFSPYSMKQIRKNIFAVKKISVNNICPVIQRVDWTSGEVYTYYQEDLDIYQKSSSGLLVYKFYVKNKYDQIFKCLWNNNGAPSTVEPYFEPGTFNDDGIFLDVDGYKWKYMYTIDTGLKVNFMDSVWVPVQIKNRAPNIYTTTETTIGDPAGAGNIEVINVLNGGSGYDSDNAAIFVTIQGDGTGATAIASDANNQIVDITVTNKGTGYTYANINITSNLGSGANAYAGVSPIGGHGSDLLTELGCEHVMLIAQFTGTEGGKISTDIDFHQVGIIVDPSVKLPAPENWAIANGTVYDCSTQLTVALGFGTYVEDEIVYQGSSLAASTFTANVLDFDSSNNVIRVINMNGTPEPNQPIFGDTSKTVRTINNINPPEYITFSGHLMFVENRSGVQRNTDGIEQFKFVLGY